MPAKLSFKHTHEYLAHPHVKYMALYKNQENEVYDFLWFIDANADYS